MSVVLLILSLLGLLAWFMNIGESGSTVFQQLVCETRSTQYLLCFAVLLSGAAVCSELERIRKALPTNKSTKRAGDSLQELKLPPDPDAGKTKACPYCRTAIPLASIALGKNVCPSCAHVFEAEEK